ncbi:MAG: DUF4431 domain-containing protein [Actinomycetota bacterium]
MLRLFFATILTVLSLAPGCAFAGCLQAQEKATIIEGVLSEKTFPVANDQPEQAFILTPLLPTCLAGDENIDQNTKVGEIQIISSNDQVTQKIKNYLGKDVFVQGTPFAANAAHHHAPIVMDVTGVLK